MTDTPGSALTYQDAGVDIGAGNELVRRLKELVRRTDRPGIMGGLGGFGGLFDLKACGYHDPILVAATDGVGTKLKLAIDRNSHDTIGIDLVAMCVNDIIVQGAEPLFFLDYFATGHLDVGSAEAVIRGIVSGCEIAGCALIGGETAEMPGLYQAGDYDLAGFCVGVVDRDRVIDGQAIVDGDALIGLRSSGPHSNGYALIRRILSDLPQAQHQLVDGEHLHDQLLTPTRIYVRTLLDLIRRYEIKGMAHITGGGLLENVPRMLPPGVSARVDTQSWQWPAIFRWLQQAGGVQEQEMLRTFNCGIGMVLAVAADIATDVVAALEESGEQAIRLGQVVTREANGAAIVLTA